MSSIMIVDDDEDIRTTLADMLEDDGHEVVRAENGQRALEALRAGVRPCLILLDLMMPVMDGWAFRAAQQQDPELASIPVVAITAAGKPVASSIDATEVIQKPFGIDQVRAAIQRYC